ncbi:MAG TPA: serine/threonine-protein kinase [Gemmatimonadales bacterium]|jgi:serine/threonine protein kinase|nr:serine/threonine-protein kinase [Gemmatimonadales bacterium]
MSALLERLRAALAPEYQVERELKTGGMGMIFLGRDTALDRPIAIKIIRPELASAHAAERFLREARTLATLNHPNVVPIHQVGEREGFVFYVMAYLEGETLAERLAKGPLPPPEAVQLGRDLLHALEAAHTRGVVHRDIKPDNIFVVGGRAVLTDFGIAKSLSDPSAAPLTAPGQPVGTLDYMPPEQAAGGEVTARTDIYSLAMVLYEALTGRHWSILDRPEAATWSGVPRRLVPALRKALAWYPEERWADAATFRRALWAPRPPALLWPSVGLGGAAVVAAIVFCGPLGICPAPVPPRPYDLMVEPFAVEGTTDPSLGKEVAFLVGDILDRFPRIRLVPPSYALERAEDSLAGRGPRPVHVVYRSNGVVAAGGDSLNVNVELRDSLGQRPYRKRVTGSARDKVDLADNIAFWVIQRIRPELVDSGYVPDSTLRGRNVAALDQFLKGEEAFRADAWSEAERHFEEALRLDTTFARAAWRLSNAQRWRRVASTVDLRTRLAGKWRYLKPLDSLLVAAELAPHGPPRYRIYEVALNRYPNDPYARLLYGAELMHRGPLAGIPLDSGVAVLEEAAAQNPSLAPAHDQLIWALIRLGRREAARLALDRLEQIRRTPAPPDLDIVATLEMAFAARFTPERLGTLLGDMSPGVQQDVARTLRFALAFDVPEAQITLGRQLAARGEPARRASGHEAQGLALVALGRPAEALAHFDSAAALYGTPTARVEALEWRLIPAALGVPGFPPAEVERARGALAGSTAARAAWALAVDAYARRDLTSARAWRVRFQQQARLDTADRQLDALLGALDAAARGATEPALALSAPLLPFDESEHWTDPFARAVLHVRRGEWLAALGHHGDADREWLWYENSDFEGWLTGEVEPVEIDWALGAWARWRRGVTVGCEELRRVVALWNRAEPAYEPLVAEARQRAGKCQG